MVDSTTLACRRSEAGVSGGKRKVRTCHRPRERDILASSHPDTRKPRTSISVRERADRRAIGRARVQLPSRALALPAFARALFVLLRGLPHRLENNSSRHGHLSHVSPLKTIARRRNPRQNRESSALWLRYRCFPQHSGVMSLQVEGIGIPNTGRLCEAQLLRRTTHTQTHLTMYLPTRPAPDSQHRQRSPAVDTLPGRAGSNARPTPGRSWNTSVRVL